MVDSSIAGVYAASLTPLNPDLTCDYQTLTEHCKDLMNKGCKGVVLFGTTGEGPSFSVAEKIAAIEALIKRGIDPQKMIIGISCCAITDVVALAQASIKNRCAAVLIVPPFYYKAIDERGVIAFYREIIHRVNDPSLRILLYHIPQFSGVPFTSSIIKTLLEEYPKIIIGMKDSEGNIEFVNEIIKKFPHLKYFLGRELLIPEAVRLGAAGSISGTANVYPELIASLYEFGRDPQKPNSSDKMEAIFQVLRNYPFTPAMKCIMENRQGSHWQALRPPLVPLEFTQSQALIEALQSIKF